MHDETSQVQSIPVAAPRSRLRLWPALVLASLVVIARVYATNGEFSPNKFFIGMMVVPMVAALGLLLWWSFASRTRRSDRFLVVSTLLAVAAATVVIAGHHFPPITLILYALPFIALMWPVWLLLTPMLNWPVRRAGILAIFLAVGTVCCMLRVDGTDGEFNPEFNFRWTPTAEQQLLAELNTAGKPAGDANAQAMTAELKERPGDWPGFRGANRDGHLVGVKLKTDWANSPPKELWKHRIGPGWSSFAVIADRIFTQEQRGDEELVVCYDATTGVEVWSHRDATRFTEVVAGPGPRDAYVSCREAVRAWGERQTELSAGEQRQRDLVARRCRRDRRAGSSMGVFEFTVSLARFGVGVCGRAERQDAHRLQRG